MSTISCSLDLSIRDFIEFCKKEGIEREDDHKKLHDEGITPKALIRLTIEDIKELKLSLGGRTIIQKIMEDLKKKKDADHQIALQGAPKNFPWCMDAFVKPREQDVQSNTTETSSAVAQRKWLWPCDESAGGITLKVKFLNSIPKEWRYRGGGLNFDTILTLAKEWEKDGTPIKFVEEEGDLAHIRVKFIDSSITHEKLLDFFGGATVQLLEQHLPIPNSEDSITQLSDEGKFREYLRVYANQNPTWEDIVKKLQKCGLKSTAGDVEDTYIKGRGTSRSYVGSRAQNVSPKPSMWLNLSSEFEDDKYKRHVVIHEFGHALGLEHEHQRPDFWDAIRKYISIDKMKKDKDLQGNLEWLESMELRLADDLILSGYDAESIMHYWFKSSWLRDDYDSEEKVMNNEDLTSVEKDALLGIHKCSPAALSTAPSKGDLDHLKTMYGKKESPPNGGAAPYDKHGSDGEGKGESSSRGAAANVAMDYCEVVSEGGKASIAKQAPQPHEVEKHADQGLDIEQIIAMVDNREFGNDDWNLAYMAIKSWAARWEDIGTALGIGGAKLEEIGANSNRAANCLSSVLQDWIGQNYNMRVFGVPCWRTLCKALLQVADNKFVVTLAKAHKGPGAHDQGETMNQGTTSSRQEVQKSAGRTAAASEGIPDFDRFKVENRFLRRIEWQTRDGNKQLNIYRKSAEKWKVIGQELGLDDGQLTGIRNDNHDNEDRVEKVLALWLDDACNLKNSRDYPLAWSALIKLLSKSDRGNLAREVHEALSAPINTVRGNM